MRASRIGGVRERFFQRFAVDVESQCWVWSGTIIRLGPKKMEYGSIGGVVDGIRYVPVGQNMLAHRVSWILHYGPIPEGSGAHGTVVRHKCDNTKCVNPEHLELGTQADNVRDMDQRGRANRNGMASRRGPKHHRASFSAEQVAGIFASNERYCDLAARFGVNVATIKRLRMGRTYGNITTPEQVKDASSLAHKRRRSGSESRSAKLTPDQVRYIRSSPLTTYQLADELGVTQPTVASARRRATYKDVL